MGQACCGERLETREKKRMREDKIKLQNLERENAILRAERDRVRIQAAVTEEDEESAWSKVTPVPGSQFESPESTSPAHKKQSSHKASFVKANHSEGEQSDEDDIEILSTGKRSNYTNTSVIVKGDNEDSDSQVSGVSGGFGYLSNPNMQQQLRRNSQQNQGSASSGSKRVLNSLKSDVMSTGKIIRMNSVSSDGELQGFEMASLDEDHQSGQFINDSFRSDGSGNPEMTIVQATKDDEEGGPLPAPKGMALMTPIVEEEDHELQRTTTDSSAIQFNM